MESGLIETAIENSNQFVESVLSKTSLDEFLLRDDHITVRHSNISRVEQDVHLRVCYDQDGIVIGINSLLSVNFPLKYINLFNSKSHLKPVFHLLKKHINIVKYAKHIKLLPTLRGVQVFYDRGWECYLTLIPEGNDVYEGNIFDLCRGYFINIGNRWREKLNKLVEEGKCLNTLRKNSISSTNTLRLLPDDQKEILSVLSAALLNSNSPDGFKPYLFIFRFGDRESGVSDLCEFDFRYVIDQTIHVAATLTGISDIGFLWSRQGLQELIGKRGTLSSCLSFQEAANFQSNLDGKAIDITADLRKLCTFPSKILFVQFYGDTPHLQPDTRPHPVSGSIVNCGLLHSQTLTAIERDADKYISVLKDNVNCIRRLQCRLEFVIALDIPLKKIYCKRCFNVQELHSILNNKSLLVPFDDSEQLVSSTLRVIGELLIEKLVTVFLNGNRLGPYIETWSAFQCELALEKLFWGRPLSPINNIYAVNLGPGLLNPSRSKTDWLGFLALEEPTSVTVDETPPPLYNWIRSDKLKAEVRVLFGFCDYLGASDCVLGRRSIAVLLQDLFAWNKVFNTFNTLLAELKSCVVPPWAICTGRTTITQFSSIIERSKGVRRMTSTGRMLTLLRQKGRNVKNVFYAGLQDMELKFVPVLKNYDTAGNRSVYWDGLHVLQLLQNDSCCDINDAYCQAATQCIIYSLAEGNYIHQSKLVSLQDRPGLQFPWIKPTLLKLQGSNVEKKCKENVVLFCSCIAFLTNGWYVDYRKLAALLPKLSLSQLQLKGMEIQSTKLLGAISNPKIYRLHSSIPVKLVIPERRLCVKEPENEEDIPHELETNQCVGFEEVTTSEINEPQTIVKTLARHHAAGTKKTWQPVELDILACVKERFLHLDLKSQYSRYQELCMKETIPDRNFDAFRRKIVRI